MKTDQSSVDQSPYTLIYISAVFSRYEHEGALEHLAFSVVKLPCPLRTILSAHAYEICGYIVSLECILGWLSVVKGPVFKQEVLHLLAVIIYKVSETDMGSSLVQVFNFDGLEVPYPCRCIQHYIELVVQEDAEVPYHVVHKGFAFGRDHNPVGACGRHEAGQRFGDVPSFKDAV